MSCVSCAARVKRALKGIEGVEHVEVSLERREAVVRFLPGKVTPQRLEAAINGLGYKAGKSRVVESK
jgi:copper chaperone CopZ